MLQNPTDLSSCPSDVECKQLPFPCIQCNYDKSCIYGKELMVTCNANPNVMCIVSWFISIPNNFSEFQKYVTFENNYAVIVIDIFAGWKRFSTKHGLSILLANRALGTFLCTQRRLQFSQSVLYVSVDYLRMIFNCFLRCNMNIFALFQSKLFGPTRPFMFRFSNISKAAEM